MAEPHVLDAELVAQVVDVFELVSDSTRSSLELAVAIDSLGRLQAWPVRDRIQLSAAAQGQLSFHELTAPLRQVRGSELHLFELQLIEQPADAPGLNDPVYLYGTLVGPFGSHSQAQRTPGQLAMTRADLLGGVLGTRPFAFRYPAQIGRDESRFQHLLVPGDREEALSAGQGMVLAYPYPPPEAADASDPDNGWLVRQIVSDVLVAMADELAEEERGFFSRLFQGSGPDLRPSDAASFAEILELAQRAFDHLARTGSSRTRALFARVSVAGPGAARPSVPVSAVPPPPAAATPRLPPRPPQPVRDPREPPEWMRDFISSNPGRPKLTGMRRVKAPAPRGPTAGSGQPQWMADFAPESDEERASTGLSANGETGLSANGESKPAWMKDFES